MIARPHGPCQPTICIAGRCISFIKYSSKTTCMARKACPARTRPMPKAASCALPLSAVMPALSNSSSATKTTPVTHVANPIQWFKYIRLRNKTLENIAAKHAGAAEHLVHAGCDQHQTEVLQSGGGQGARSRRAHAQEDAAAGQYGAGTAGTRAASLRPLAGCLLGSGRPHAPRETTTCTTDQRVNDANQRHAQEHNADTEPWPGKFLVGAVEADTPHGIPSLSQDGAGRARQQYDADQECNGQGLQARR
mmetsp:Transcript_62632/g.181554  ORF Transcript_62632/g.181554 Transcript_62632/m.181554 type:complete len:250 (+) Transcript_62632:692-1441(+)